jgi:hypothetical protein
MSPIAHRVARRHQATAALRDAHSSSMRMEGTCISATELTKMLEPIVGVLKKMVFHRSPAGTIGWAAVDPEGSTVSGTLALRYMRRTEGLVPVDGEESEERGDDGQHAP